VHLATFSVGLAHHLAAFFAWAWLALHVVVPLLTAGFHISNIQREGLNFFDGGGLHWRALLVLALIPAVLVALHQAYLSWKQLPHRHHHADRPSPLMHLLTSPTRLGSFLASVAHHTAGFFAWAWMVLAVIGGLGTAGFSLTRLWDFSIGYFASMGGDQWLGLLALALVPSVAFAFWNTRRSWHQLHAWAHEHPLHHRHPGGGGTTAP